MASLFERLAGTGTGPSSGKLAVEGFIALFYAIRDGDITALEAATALGLDAGQRSQASALLSQVAAHPRPREFLEWLYRQLVLAELPNMPTQYKDEAQFTARVLAELSRG